MTLITHERRTARKAHWCSEDGCHHVIKPGEEYEYQAIVDSDGIRAFKTCLSCLGWWDVVYLLTDEDRNGVDFLIERLLWDYDGAEGWTEAMEKYNAK